MSGSGGGKPGVRAFWDPGSNQVLNIQDGINALDNSYESFKEPLMARIEILEKRLEQLEIAYMEEKLLGKTE